MQNINQDFEKYADLKPFNKKVAPSWFKAFKESCETINKKPSQIKVLDYGCGDGKYFFAFKKTGLLKKNIYGVEVSKKRIKRCKSIGMKNVFLINGTSTLPFKNKSFDIINMMEVIEHIPLNQSITTLRELSRVLDSKGVLLISTPNYPIKRFYDYYEAIINKKLDRLHDDPTHVTKYSYQKLKRKLLLYFQDIKKREFKNGFLYNRLKIKFFLHKVFFICKKNE